MGVVCMDQMMIDVTEIPEAREGDEVCFLGDDIIVNDYAAWAGLNRNESLGRIGPPGCKSLSVEGTGILYPGCRLLFAVESGILKEDRGTTERGNGRETIF